jgi:hypothetical protein
MGTTMTQDRKESGSDIVRCKVQSVYKKVLIVFLVEALFGIRRRAL